MRPLLLPLLLLPSLLLSAPACGASKREARQETRAVRRESARLGESADLYWRALRWEDLGVAANFIEDPDYRVRWMSDHPSARGGYRYRSVSVARVEVDEASEPGGAHLREARVIVQIEGYQANEQVVRAELLVQDWYRTPSGWYVQPGQEYGREP